MIKSLSKQKIRTNPSKRWYVYDAKAEFARMTSRLGPDCPWTVTQANENFKLCETYPPVLIVPRDIGDAELKKVASYRSKQRLPVAAWIHPESGAAILRSSQALFRF